MCPAVAHSAAALPAARLADCARPRAAPSRVACRRPSACRAPKPASWARPVLPAPRAAGRPPVWVSASGGKPDGGQTEEVDAGEQEEEGWGLLDLGAYNKGWQVPWGGGDVVLGMSLWLVSFVAVGLVVVPLVGRGLGFELGVGKLDQMAQAELTLINQAIETVVGLLAIYLIAGKFELPGDLFKLSVKDPLRKPDGWAVWVLWGYVLAPIVVGLVVNTVEAVGYDESGRGTVDAVSQIIDIDGSTYLSLITVTGVLAPLLEETVFRGFLLTSLTKWMPTSLAVVLSSVAFGLCHLSPKDFPQLVCLGMVLGFSYVRSRNLLTPMIIHGTWNSTVLTLLYALTASGVDLENMLSGQS
mmetsp:Transcript_40973/g.105995  ORF Transcript_40973/g.105995 Transcript_40973/m.105995 type:complete len:357 (+) Transcript_40973:247-1317(+)